MPQHPSFATALDLVDLIGFAAALLTLGTFVQRAMLPMRVTAIGANVCFIFYGAMGHFVPVLALHLILLPVNVLRLGQEVRAARKAANRLNPRFPMTTTNQESAGLFSIF
jgi:hypothetical protein